MSDPRYQRRRKLPKPGIQLRLIGAFCGLAILTGLVQLLLVARELVLVADRFPDGGGMLIRELPDLFARVGLLSCLLVVPATVCIGVLVTFKLAGPIYRFERYLQAVIRGEAHGPCAIRKGDELQELCDLINAALAAERARSATKSEASSEGEAERLAA